MLVFLTWIVFLHLPYVQFMRKKNSTALMKPQMESIR